MIIDGKAIAAAVIDALPHGTGLQLGVVMDRSHAASDSFVRMKEKVAAQLGVRVVRYVPEDMEQAFADSAGIIVQLPIEGGEALLAMLPPEKDVDALGPAPLVRAPVAEAVREVLVRHAVEVSGRKAVVVGEGRLVGKPAAQLLRDMGAKVVVISLEQGSLEELQDADIVVTGAGSPNLIQPQMLKRGVVLIDAGTSESAGKLAGDADPSCAGVASLFTPVPGGVGPIAVAMIFKNLFTLVRKENPSDLSRRGT